MTEAMMRVAAKPEMRLALRGDIEARCELPRVGSGGFGEQVNGGASLELEVPIGEVLHRLACDPGRRRAYPHHFLDRVPGELRPVGWSTNRLTAKPSWLRVVSMPPKMAKTTRS